MKHLRILALILAAMLCLTACGAKDEKTDTQPTAAPTAEPTAETAEAAETAEDDGPMAAANEAVMIGSLAMPYESWMTEEMYSFFAATFFMDLLYVDAQGVNAMVENCGVPAVYVGELEGDNYGNGMNLALFFTDPETSENTMINATVYLATGLFDSSIAENAGDPAAKMESLVTDGTLKVYHAVTEDAFMTAYGTLTQLITGAGAESAQ